MRLSPRLALKISRACAVDFSWLTNNNAGDEIINDRGKPCDLRDFEEAQQHDETLAFWHSVPEMEFAVGYDLLCREYEKTRDSFARAQLIDDFTDFVVNRSIRSTS